MTSTLFPRHVKLLHFPHFSLNCTLLVMGWLLNQESPNLWEIQVSPGPLFIENKTSGSLAVRLGSKKLWKSIEKD